jgi:purine-binding chemotaxis protein CheW
VALREARNSTSVISRVGERHCALPLAHVVETMRLGPLEPIGGAPPYVLGVATIRGELVPVVDLAQLLGIGGAQPARLVTIDVDNRRVALAVDAVIGVREIDDEAHHLPPLLRDAGADVVASVARLDGQLLLVLQAARLVPDDIWDGQASGVLAP